MKEFKPFENFLDPAKQISAVDSIYEIIMNSDSQKKNKYFEGLISLLDRVDEFENEVSRKIIFSFQWIQQNGGLENNEKITAFTCLYKLCKTNVFKKKYAFSNAVSITLREFYNDPAFPKGEITKGYNYLLKNMAPISKGFGSRRCQVCWNKTFKDIISILNIPKDRNLELSIYNITQLNLFHVQMGDSYDEEMNKLMNNFYKKFFKDIKSVNVHDSASDDKESKLADKKMQKQGIDKTLLTQKGKKIFIEEKFRSFKFWDLRNKDILLEYISIDNKNIPGWVYTSKSDFLIVVFQHLDIIKSELYVFPFEPIRKWVRENNSAFMKFQDISAPNVNWNTISKAVPLITIFEILKKEDKKYSTIHKIK
jgi:hypothetical protein